MLSALGLSALAFSARAVRLSLGDVSQNDAVVEPIVFTRCTIGRRIAIQWQSLHRGPTMLRTICLLAFETATSIACAQSFNIDFGSATVQPPAAFGAAAGQRGVWNQIGAIGRGDQLSNLLGSSTGASLALTADSILGLSTVPRGSIGRLVSDDFFSAEASNWKVLITGLQVGTYDIYFYAGANSIVPTGDFTVNGISVSSFGPASGTTLIEGSDYEALKGSVITGSLLLQSTRIFDFGGLAGMQIVSYRSVMAAVPEPSVFELTLAGLGLLGAYRKRRIAALARVDGRVVPPAVQ